MSDAEVIPEVYEQAGTFEHDAIAIFQDAVVIIEAKAGRGPRTLRDVEKAFKLVERQFSSETGIQKEVRSGESSRATAHLTTRVRWCFSTSRTAKAVRTFEPGACATHL